MVLQIVRYVTRNLLKTPLSMKYVHHALSTNTTVIEVQNLIYIEE